MTNEILTWLEHVARPYLLPSAGRVLEVGALNVNGTPRTVIQDIATEYIGTDMQGGPGVDRAVNNSDLYSSYMSDEPFDTVICCECLEHDLDFYVSLDHMEALLKSGGCLIITTPTFGFPLHRYPKDYWRFGEDAYREVFFGGMDILDLRHLNSLDGQNTTLAGIARKR